MGTICLLGFFRNQNHDGALRLSTHTGDQGGTMIIIRAVFSLAVLALVGGLVVALSGHLWSRYQEETAVLGYGGVSKRLASQVGDAGPVNAFWAFVEAELGPALRSVREVEAQPVSPPVARGAAAIEE
jgi:hypothetical protein